jgi:hypothetical protein
MPIRVATGTKGTLTASMARWIKEWLMAKLVWLVVLALALVVLYLMFTTPTPPAQWLGALSAGVVPASSNA